MAITFQSQFAAFSKFGDTRSEGKLLTLTQSDKWMKQAGVIDKKLTTTDTAISFNKFKKKSLSLEEYQKFIEDLAKAKNIAASDIREKMTNSGAPRLSRATQGAASSVVDRLTDTSKYTGAHKERFDESGKGKGKAGREDEAATDGYVSGYKQKDTYDNKK